MLFFPMSDYSILVDRLVGDFPRVWSVLWPPCGLREADRSALAMADSSSGYLCVQFPGCLSVFEGIDPPVAHSYYLRCLVAVLVRAIGYFAMN